MSHFPYFFSAYVMFPSVFLVFRLLCLSVVKTKRLASSDPDATVVSPCQTAVRIRQLVLATLIISHLEFCSRIKLPFGIEQVRAKPQ
jgi:hypothetical protein